MMAALLGAGSAGQHPIAISPQCSAMTPLFQMRELGCELTCAAWCCWLCRRVNDRGAVIPSVFVSPSKSLVSGPLGSHVLQLLHIAQLKDSISLKHSTQLHAAIAEKERKNALILSQQQQQLTDRPPPPPDQPQPIPPIPAAMPPPTPLPLPSPHAPELRETALRSAAATGRLRDFLAGLPAEVTAPSSASTTSTPSAPLSLYSDVQLLNLLPPLLAVHFLHCGFTSFSQSALQVMAEATIDRIRRGGTAVRLFTDRPPRPPLPPPVKAENGPTRNGGGKGGEGEALRRRVCHQMGMGTEKDLRRWYDERIRGVGERLKRTEARLTGLQQRIAEGGDPFHIPQLLGVVEGTAAAAAMFSCEPFSPLQSLLHPPTLPATPKPLIEEKEPPPLVKLEPSPVAAMEVQGGEVKVEEGVSTGQQPIVNVEEPPLPVQNNTQQGMVD